MTTSPVLLSDGLCAYVVAARHELRRLDVEPAVVESVALDGGLRCGEDLVLGLVAARVDVPGRALPAVAGDQGAAVLPVPAALQLDVAAHAARFERGRQLIEELSDPVVIEGSRHAVLVRARRGLAHSRARRAG